MGKFKEIGCPALALAEECAEVIQVINKKFRFDGDWNEIPEGKEKSRIQELNDEMEDLIFQYRRFMKENNYTSFLLSVIEAGEDVCLEQENDYLIMQEIMRQEEMQRMENEESLRTINFK